MSSDLGRAKGRGLPAKLAGHPSVQAVLARRESGEDTAPPPVIDAAWLRQVCREAGADDSAAISVDHPDLAGEREHVQAALPGTRSLISIVVRMNRDNYRTSARSVANHEFHHADDVVNHAARDVARALQDAGYRAINPAAGFPQEMDGFPGRLWVVSHKTVAVAAGMGVMGIHRNVIHPKFGNFILLATIMVDAEVGEHGRELDYSPCVECKLCVAACPVGAISKDGDFDFFGCMTHNYREFMNGFTDWVQIVADSKDATEFRSRVTDAENASMWQSLSFKPSYKSGYCVAVCPAGEDVLGPYLEDRKGFMETVVRPLQAKEETIYVMPGSNAQAHVQRRFPHKPVKEVTGGWSPPPPKSEQEPEQE